MLMLRVSPVINFRKKSSSFFRNLKIITITEMFNLKPSLRNTKFLLYLQGGLPSILNVDANKF